MLRNKLLVGVAVSSVLLSGCFLTDEETACADDVAKKVTDSSGRDLCLTLDTVAGSAPFSGDERGAGRVQHKVTISNIDGTALDMSGDTIITAVSQYPLMTMGENCDGHIHSTPVAHMADKSAADKGEFVLTTYYSMPSKMGETVMGCWDYQVKLTDSGSDDPLKASFMPEVMPQEAGNVFMARGQNDADKWKNTMGNEAERRYSVWLESVAVSEAEGEYDVKLYVSTENLDPSAATDMSSMDDHSTHMHKIAGREDDMHMEMDSATYPAVATDLELHDEAGEKKAVSAAMVRVSTTGDGNDWQDLSMVMMGDAHMDGYYSASIAGLTSGDAATLYVQLTVNDKVMTTDGAAEDLIDSADAEDTNNLVKLTFTAP